MALQLRQTHLCAGFLQHLPYHTGQRVAAYLAAEDHLRPQAVHGDAGVGNAAAQDQLDIRKIDGFSLHQDLVPAAGRRWKLRDHIQRRRPGHHSPSLHGQDQAFPEECSACIYVRRRRTTASLPCFRRTE